MEIWICDECGLTTTSRPVYALCYSTTPHKVSYKMRLAEPRYCILYADGHRGEDRSYESVLTLLRFGRRYRLRGIPVHMVPVKVEFALFDRQYDGKHEHD